MSIENPPAFPHNPSWRNGTDPHEGMSLHDWFAGMAMAGLLSGQFAESGNHNFDGLPREAFNIADAMLAARAHQSAHFNDGDL